MNTRFFEESLDDDESSSEDDEDDEDVSLDDELRQKALLLTISLTQKLHKNYK